MQAREIETEMERWGMEKKQASEYERALNPRTAAIQCRMGSVRIERVEERDVGRERDSKRERERQRERERTRESSIHSPAKPEYDPATHGEQKKEPGYSDAAGREVRYLCTFRDGSHSKGRKVTITPHHLQGYNGVYS
jgi:hypothetical protein